MWSNLVIFSITFSAAKISVPVARAPAPGRRVTVDSEWLGRVAHLNGISWQPASSFDQIAVERSSVTISREQIEAELIATLVRQGAAPNIQIELTNGAQQLAVPAESGANIGVQDVTYDEHLKRFSATLEIPANQPNSQRIKVSGRIYSTIDVPVLSHAVPRGEVISSHDLNWIKTREDTLRHDVITDVDQIVGMTPRSPMRVGQMVTNSEIQKPVAIVKGALVTLVLKSGTMTLSAQGRALEQGSLGDTIHVINTHSNLTVEGKVEGPNMVSVIPTGSVLVN